MWQFSGNGIIARRHLRSAWRRLWGNQTHGGKRRTGCGQLAYPLYELYYSSDEEDTEDDWGADDDAKVYTYEAAGIKNLDIDIDAAEIYVKQGTDDKNLVVRTYGCKRKIL